MWVVLMDQSQVEDSSRIRKTKGEPALGMEQKLPREQPWMLSDGKIIKYPWNLELQEWECTKSWKD